MRILSFVLCLALAPAAAWAQNAPPSLIWEWTAMYPSLPAGTVQAIGQLDGIGADEIVVYHPPTGRAWIVWIGRDFMGAPVYCYEAQQFPPGFVAVGIGHFDTWAVDGSDQRKDLVLIPAAGPLYFATTHLNRAGGCYASQGGE